MDSVKNDSTRDLSSPMDNNHDELTKQFKAAADRHEHKSSSGDQSNKSGHKDGGHKTDDKSADGKGKDGLPHTGRSPEEVFIWGSQGSGPETYSSVNDDAIKSWLNGLGGGFLTSDNKASLEKVGNSLATVANFYRYPAHRSPGSNPDALPQNVKQAEQYLRSIPGLDKQLEGNGGGGMAVEARDMLGKLNSAANTAKSSWESFKKDDPHADALTRYEATEESLLQGDFPLLDNAGALGKPDGSIGLVDLRAAVSSHADAALPEPLKSAAKLFSSPGMFDMLNRASSNPTQAPGRFINNGNLDAMLSHFTPKNADQSLEALQNAALENAVENAGGNANKITPKDWAVDGTFKGAPGISNADKTAALLQLSKAQGAMIAGNKYIDSENPYWKEKGPNATALRLKKAITTLSQDPGVQAFIQNHMSGSLQHLVHSNGTLESSVDEDYTHSASLQSLENAFQQKGPNGNPIGTTAALNIYAGRVNAFGQALGFNPKLGQNLMEDAYEKAPPSIKEKIMQGYHDITSGQEMADLEKQGLTPEHAVIQATSDKVSYDSVLPHKTVQKGTAEFDAHVTKIARENLTDGKSADDLLKGLGVNGLNDPDLLKVIRQHMDVLDPPGQTQVSPGDIVSALRSINDSLRQGYKFDDALAKASKGWTASKSNNAAGYKKGAFHIASSLLLAGAIGGSQGSNSTEQNIQQAIQAGGLLTEGGAKYYADSKSSTKQEIGEQEKELGKLEKGTTEYKNLQGKINNDKTAYGKLVNISKDFENIGKSLGVAGAALGVVFGAIGAASDAQNGDTGGAVTGGITSGISGIQAIAGAGEISGYVAGRVFGAAASTIDPIIGAFGALGATAGAAAAVAEIGLTIFQLVELAKQDAKDNQDENAWYNQLRSGIAPLEKLPDFSNW